MTVQWKSAVHIFALAAVVFPGLYSAVIAPQLATAPFAIPGWIPWALGLVAGSLLYVVNILPSVLTPKASEAPAVPTPPKVGG